jgi:hypothetical protein
VYAYLTHLPVDQWGLDWLRSGTMAARLSHPVYDAELVTIDGTLDGEAMDLTLRGPDGQVRATGRAALGAPAGDQPIPDEAAVPDRRPPASAATLRPGTVLGSIAEQFDATRAVDYLASVREDLPLYAEGPYAHPAWLLRFANSVLSTNVRLGPWLHVSSEVTLLGVVGDGQAIDVRGVVVDEYERKGHRFVELDVAVLAEGDLVQRIAHTAIHTPRMGKDG